MLSTNKEEMKSNNMRIFTVISFGDKNLLRKKIEELYPDYYVPHEKGDLTFIHSNETTTQIANKLGLDDKSKEIGVVIENDTWFGFADAELWEWGSKNE